MSAKFNDIKCTKCKKLLCKGSFYEIEIKCPRCKQVAVYLEPPRASVKALPKHKEVL